MSKSEWVPASLGDFITSINSGVSVNSNDRPKGPGEIGVLKTSAVSAGLFKAHENKVVAKRDRSRVAEPLLGGTVLFSRMNTPQLVGESCYVEEGDPSLFLPDRLWQIRVDPERVDARWFSYLLLEPRIASEIKGLATGTSGSMKNIAKASFLGIRAILPPLDEQRRIAAVLDVLGDRIRTTGQIIEKRRHVHEGLLQRLFDSSRSDLPSMSIGVVADSYAGGTPSRSVPGFYGGGIPWVKSGEVNRSSIEWTEETISAAALQSSSVRWVPAEVPVVAMYGATAGVVSWTRIRVTTNQAVLAIVPRTNNVSARWLYWALVKYSPVILTSVQGSGQPNLSKAIIDRVFVPVPSREDQARTAEILDSSQKDFETEAALLHKLQKVKIGLMADLLAGRVRIPEGAVS